MNATISDNWRRPGRPGRPPLKTPWFSWRTEPSKTGPFEHNTGDGKPYSFWNGVSWCLHASTPEEAAASKNMPYATPIRYDWRGLRHKPKEA